MKKTFEKIGRKIGDGLYYLYDKYPWLGTMSGKKTLIAGYTGALDLAVMYFPKIAPVAQPAETYGVPILTGVSFVMALWGLTHKWYKREKELRNKENENGEN